MEQQLNMQLGFLVIRLKGQAIDRSNLEIAPARQSLFDFASALFLSFALCLSLSHAQTDRLFLTVEKIAVH